MPNYVWKGRNRAGLVQEGVLAADSKEVALASLRRQNIVVTGIRERGKEISLTKVGRKVPPKTLAVFTRQFSVMIDAGLPLVQCIEILANQQEHKNFQKILLQVRQDVEAGLDPRRRDAPPPQGVRHPLRQHGRRRRGGRYPRHDPPAPLDLHREGRQAARRSARHGSFGSVPGFPALPPIWSTGVGVVGT